MRLLELLARAWVVVTWLALCVVALLVLVIFWPLVRHGPPTARRRGIAPAYQRDEGDETDAVPEGLGLARCPREYVVPVETLPDNALRALLDIRLAHDQGRPV